MADPFDPFEETERCLRLLRHAEEPSVRAAALGQLLTYLNMKALDTGLTVQILIDHLLQSWEQWEDRDGLGR